MGHLNHTSLHAATFAFARRAIRCSESLEPHSFEMQSAEDSLGAEVKSVLDAALNGSASCRREPKECDVPCCGFKEIPSDTVEHDNIECLTCAKFVCTTCTNQIWTGTWNGDVFHKPCFVGPGMVHEVWRCPFCRDSFDRIRQVE